MKNFRIVLNFIVELIKNEFSSTIHFKNQNRRRYFSLLQFYF